MTLRLFPVESFLVHGHRHLAISCALSASFLRLHLLEKLVIDPSSCPNLFSQHHMWSTEGSGPKSAGFRAWNRRWRERRTWREWRRERIGEREWRKRKKNGSCRRKEVIEEMKVPSFISFLHFLPSFFHILPLSLFFISYGHLASFLHFLHIIYFLPSLCLPFPFLPSFLSFLLFPSFLSGRNRERQIEKQSEGRRRKIEEKVMSYMYMW